MAEFNPYRTIVRPILTERSTVQKEKFNQYVFEVAIDATKGDVRRALQEIFKVKVERVRTLNVRGKFRRFGRYAGVRPNWKKAVVTIKAGQKIDLVEQA
ncbi:MAG: 50S ribosomal protein L23 [Elusimicrobia bacterium]|nr:50S ribosomal protein L23 [Elusimicrobiota bacterium]